MIKIASPKLPSLPSTTLVLVGSLERIQVPDATLVGQDGKTLVVESKPLLCGEDALREFQKLGRK